MAKPAAPAQDDLFGSNADKVTDNGYRVWTDDTGTFRVNARLVVVLDGKVRLLKDTGKFTTVPFTRLSGLDLQFVEEQQKLATIGTK